MYAKMFRNFSLFAALVGRFFSNDLGGAGNGCMDGGRRGKEWNAFLAFTIGLIPWSDGAGRENTSL